MVKQTMEDALAAAKAQLKQRRRERQLESAAPDLLAACKKQHAALDMLFATLIARSPAGDTFHPSKSGPPWEAMIAGHDAIAKAEGTESNRERKDAT